MKLVISLVEYNSTKLLTDFLNQVKSYKGKNDLEAWVLDNNPDDQASNMIKEKFPWVKLTKSGKNLGFAKAQNINLKKINSELILITNPDTNFDDQAIDNMIEFMKEKTDCGISSPKLKNISGGVEANGGDLPFGLGLISWLLNLEILGIKQNFHRLDKDYYKDSHEVGWVAGTFMFTRKQVLERVGYFNENYFMYFEDVDLCFRAKKLGFKIMINPSVEVAHISGGSSKNPKLNQWKGEFKGLISFYNSVFGIIPALLVRLFVYFTILLRIGAFIISGKLDYAKNYGKVFFSI